MNHTILPDEGARKWLFKYAKKNYWRVAQWIDFDDLIQDGYVEYYEVLKRYPSATEPAHIMQLFKLCFCSKLEDLVRANTKQVDDARSDLVEVYESPLMVVPDSSVFTALVVKAPQLVRDTIALLADEKNRDVLSAPFKRYDNGRRETLNERVCSMLGLDYKSVDAVGTTRMYFTATA